MLGVEGVGGLQKQGRGEETRKMREATDSGGCALQVEGKTWVREVGDV